MADRYDKTGQIPPPCDVDRAIERALPSHQDAAHTCIILPSQAHGGNRWIDTVSRRPGCSAAVQIRLLSRSI